MMQIDKRFKEEKLRIFKCNVSIKEFTKLENVEKRFIYVDNLHIFSK
jgi:hypothetical protein